MEYAIAVNSVSPSATFKNMATTLLRSVASHAKSLQAAQ
jgi:hypothetical protein